MSHKNRIRFSTSALILSLLLAGTSVAKAEEVDATPISPDQTAQEATAASADTAELTSTDTATPAAEEPAGVEDAIAEPVVETTGIAETSEVTETSDADSEPAAEPVGLLSATADTTAADTEDTKPVEGQTVDLRILSTTDLHTNLINYDYYQDKESQTVGLAKTAVLIDEAKAENSNVILLDNGDTVQGTPLGTYKALVDQLEEGEQHPMYAALEILGYDAGTFGNHEFNYGLDFLQKVIDTAGISLLNANVVDATTHEPIFKTYEIFSKTLNDTNGNPVVLNIGVTGIVPPQIMNWDKANLEGKVIVHDAVEALEALVPEMKKAGADIVVVLSHSGIGDDVYEKGEENVGYQIAGIEGVTAVVTGHSHSEFPGGGSGAYSGYAGVDDVNGLINGIPVTMAGKYGDHLGVIDLNLTYTDGQWVTNEANGEIRKIDTKSDAAHEKVIEVAKEAHQGTVDYVNQAVGYTTAPINSYFALVMDDPSVQIVNNAQIWYAKQELAGTPEADLPILSAAAPFKAGGRDFSDITNYTDIKEGSLAIKNVADLYLYDNVTAILKITGADVREWLEMSAGQFNQIDPTSTEPQDLLNSDFRTYNFDVIDGVTYEFDVTQPQKYDRSGKIIDETANRVKNLRYNGELIDDNQEFIVVTNNYRASGPFPMIKTATMNELLNLENRQVIINYILEEKTINPSADNNWSFSDTIKGLDLRFLTSEAAQDLIAEDERVEFIASDETREGFGVYRYNWIESAAEVDDTKPIEGQSVSVRILSTTDLHTNLINYDYYQDKASQSVGLAKTAVLIDEAKAENPNVILLDNGDTIQGTPLGTYKAIVDQPEEGEQHPMYAALQALGFEAGTLGNHEFNYGLDYLNQVIAYAGMPIVNANVRDAKTGEPVYKTHEIITKTFTDTAGNPVSLNIGITGIVPPQIMDWDKSHLEGLVTVQDSVEALQELVPDIKAAGADIVIVLAHAGIGDDVYEKGEENTGYQITQIPDVDAVVTGHNHAKFPDLKTAAEKRFYSKYANVNEEEGLINGIPVTMAGKNGDHLGVIDIDLTYTNGKWTTTAAKAEIREIDSKSDVASQTVLDVAKEAHDATVSYVNQAVGQTTSPITSFFALVKDDPSVQIVNNAQIWYAKRELAGTPEADLPILSAAAPFKSGYSDAGYYTDIPAGGLAIKNVADLYLYDNITTVLKITGADLREWLEMSAGNFNQIDPTSTEPQNILNSSFKSYNFDIIDGVTYEYDITQPARYDTNGNLIDETASRLRNLRYNGEEVADDQEFIIVTNNYRADKPFPGAKNATLNHTLNLENRQVIIEYILEQGVINPSADNNWGFADSIKGLDLRFQTAERAKTLLTDGGDVLFLQAAADREGYGDFQYIWTETVAEVEVPTEVDKPAETKPELRPLTPQERQDITETIRQTLKGGGAASLADAFNTSKTTATLSGQGGVASSSRQAKADKSLPNTAAAESSLLGFAGLNILGLAGIFGRKTKKR